MSGYIVIAKSDSLPKLTIILTLEFNPLKNLDSLKNAIQIDSLELIYFSLFNGYPYKGCVKFNCDLKADGELGVGKPEKENSFFAENLSKFRSGYFKHGYQITIKDALQLVCVNYCYDFWSSSDYKNNVSKIVNEKWRKYKELSNDFDRNYELFHNEIAKLEQKWKPVREAIDKLALEIFRESPKPKKIESSFFDFFLNLLKKDSNSRNRDYFYEHLWSCESRLNYIYEQNVNKKYKFTVSFECNNKCGFLVDYYIANGSPKGFCKKCNQEVSEFMNQYLDYVVTQDSWVANWCRKYREMGGW
jgi:hypothetical protein